MRTPRWTRPWLRLTAYGWADYSPAMADNEILARLLALNHERAAQT